MKLRTARWFRFSLRTCFVAITAVCCWLGWNLYLTSERAMAKQWVKEQGGQLREGDAGLSCAPQAVYVRQKAMFPAYRAWFGDEPLFYINLTRGPFDWADRTRLAKLFPEAAVMPERADYFEWRKQSLAAKEEAARSAESLPGERRP